MKTNTFSSLSNPALIAVGSVDGVLTSAAVLRLIGRDCQILFTQAFTVDRLDLSSLPTGSEIVLVDLAVNLKAPQMTVDFLRRLRAAGHHLVAIIDEHGRADWFAALAHAGDDPDGDRPGLVGVGTHHGRQFLAVPADPARSGHEGGQPVLFGAAVHRLDGLGLVR